MMEVLAYTNFGLIIITMAFFYDRTYVKKLEETSAWIGSGFILIIVISVILTVGIILGG